MDFFDYVATKLQELNNNNNNNNNKSDLEEVSDLFDTPYSIVRTKIYACNDFMN